MAVKAELHCHIEGAATPRMVTEQAAKYGCDTNSYIRDGRFSYHDFDSFLAAYDAAASLFRSEADYARLAESYLTSLARGGAIYSEIFVSPDHAGDAGLTPAAYVGGLAEGISRANAKTGIECRMIVVGIRHLGIERVEAAARFAARCGHPLVTGFGMSGREGFGDFEDYVRAFEIAREAGLGITVHAGELAGWESVASAIEHLRPARIGHGVRAIENAELVSHIAERGITLECCIGSNMALGLFDRIANHPFGRLRAAGCKVTLNSDDPPYFGTSLEHEYDLARRHFGLTERDLNAITRTAIEAAFVDPVTRKALLGRVDAGSRA